MALNGGNGRIVSGNRFLLTNCEEGYEYKAAEAKFLASIKT
jgi:hypothetical protein